ATIRRTGELGDALAQVGELHGLVCEPFPRRAAHVVQGSAHRALAFAESTSLGPHGCRLAQRAENGTDDHATSCSRVGPRRRLRKVRSASFAAAWISQRVSVPLAGSTKRASSRPSSWCTTKRCKGSPVAGSTTIVSNFTKCSSKQTMTPLSSCTAGSAGSMVDKSKTRTNAPRHPTPRGIADLAEGSDGRPV